MAETQINKMTNIIDELEGDDLSHLETTETKEPGEHLPAKLDEFEEVFTLELLKQDFMSMRVSILAVINKGQKILDDVEILEISDMKASQLEALSSLQRSTGENIKLLMGIYKDIISVEKDKYVLLRGLDQENLGAAPPIHTGDNITQNVIVAGGTHDILRELIEANKPIEIREL